MRVEIVPTWYLSDAAKTDSTCLGKLETEYLRQLLEVVKLKFYGNLIINEAEGKN